MKKPMKQAIVLHAPSKKALQELREHVRWAIESLHDSGEGPVGIWYHEEKPKPDKEA